MSVLRIVLLVASLIALGIVCKQVFDKKLSLRYSFLWIILALVILVCAIFPVIPYRLSDLCGFVTPSNFILVVAVLFLLAICLSLSVVVSKLQKRINTLVQEVALLKKENDK